MGSHREEAKAQRWGDVVSPGSTGLLLNLQGAGPVVLPESFLRGVMAQQTDQPDQARALLLSR